MRSTHSAGLRAAAIALTTIGLAHTAYGQPPGAAADTPAASFLAHSPQYPLLPRDLETELALSAAPRHLRDAASVLVLGPTGYVTALQRGGAFTCLVSRRGGDLFPVCWDAEGVRSLLPVDLDDARLRLEGKSGAEIEQTIMSGYKDGRYRPPARAGIAYMLSPLRYRIDEGGHATRSTPNPHVMFYAPNLTDADIGGQRGSVAFINKVGPDGMIIVPVGQQERETIAGESRVLTERLERILAYTPQR